MTHQAPPVGCLDKFGSCARKWHWLAKLWPAGGVRSWPILHLGRAPKTSPTTWCFAAAICARCSRPSFPSGSRRSVAAKHTCFRHSIRCSRRSGSLQEPIRRRCPSAISASFCRIRADPRAPSERTAGSGFRPTFSAHHGNPSRGSRRETIMGAPTPRGWHRLRPHQLRPRRTGHLDEDDPKCPYNCRRRWPALQNPDGSHGTARPDAGCVHARGTEPRAIARPLPADAGKPAAHSEIHFQAQCSLPDVFAELKSKRLVCFNEGRIGAQVERITPDGAQLRVVAARPRGEKFRCDMALNFPGTDLHIPPLTEKDLHLSPLFNRHDTSTHFYFASWAGSMSASSCELKRSSGIVLMISRASSSRSLARRVAA